MDIETYNYHSLSSKIRTSCLTNIVQNSVVRFTEYVCLRLDEL